MKRANPPRLVELFFAWFCHRTHQEGLEGDLYELFERRLVAKGRFNAQLGYLLDVCTLLRRSVAREFFKNSTLIRMDTFRSYLRTALRIAWRWKTYTAINILGLTMGITCLLFVLVFVEDELAYDQHIANASHKYRVYNETHKMGESGTVDKLAIVPPMFAPTLKEDFSQVVKVGRVFYDYGGTLFHIGEQVISLEDGIYAEREALEILDLKLVSGDLVGLEEPQTMIVSQTTFEKFFGDTPFDNQVVKLSRSTLKIVGVYEDFKRQSHIRPGYIFSFQLLTKNVPVKRMQSWNWQQFFTYVQLDPQVNLDEFEATMSQHLQSLGKPFTEEYSFYYIPALQSITDIHLGASDFQWEIAEVGNGDSIMFLLSAAMIILVIAGLNFVNLTTSQSIKRAKEVGVRKFIGASKGQLLFQCIVESMVITTSSGLLSLILMVVLLPFFNQFSGKLLFAAEVFTPIHLSLVVLGVASLGLLAGWYPAMIITRFRAIEVLHGISGGRTGIGNLRVDWNFRQALVGIQFLLSIGLILISLVIQRQYEFLLNTDMGFNKDNVMVVPLTRTLRNDLESTRAAFSQSIGVDEVSFCYGVPGGIVAGDGIIIPRIKDSEITSHMFIVDPNYLDVMGMEMVSGRKFSSELTSDTREAFILNETAVRNFGLGSMEDAVGEPVQWKMWRSEDTLKRGKVIGVVRDFNFKSLHNEIGSVVMHIQPENYSYMLLKLGAGNLTETVSRLEGAYRAFEPNRPFEFEFVDNTFQQFYESEKKLGGLFSLFTVLAIITAAIGLYAMVSFSVVSRSKELTIRKVLGAASITLFTILVRRYFLLVAGAMVVAIPLAYYIASSWLDGFAYRISISLMVMLQVVLYMLVFTILTVVWQAWRGVQLNPAQRLRSE